jgi:glycosyltransferase involved in cell wall biosynthesis
VKKVAYLVNQYPCVSHTFIRREIAALEALGVEVARLAIRPHTATLLDPADEAERVRTQTLLDLGVVGLLSAALRAAVRSPLRFAQALALALRLGRRSERGVAVHLIYLTEACALDRWLVTKGTQHLHAHFGTNPAAVALLCRVLGGPPYSFTVHGPEEFDTPRALALDEKVRQAAFVVAVSDFGRSQLYRWADPADWPRIHVVRCGVDAEFLGAPPGSPPGVPRLVCVGRLAEQKGQLLLVEAAARLRNRGLGFELVIVGDGPLRPAIEAIIARHDLRGCVRLTGSLDGAGVRREVRAARALVLPSFAEGLPVVIMEALALARPVISTYVAGIPELVCPGENGWLVPAGSVEALADAMASALAANPAELARLGRAGAARISERHDAAAEAGRLLALMFPQAAARSGLGTSETQENLNTGHPAATLD